MTQPDPRQTVALFRYGLIAELVHLPLDTQGCMRNCGTRQTSPMPSQAAPVPGWQPRPCATGSRATAAAASTRSCPRCALIAGSPRAGAADCRPALPETKDQHPDYSVALVIADVTARVKLPDGLRLSPSTVHRVLSRAGLMQKSRRSRRSRSAPLRLRQGRRAVDERRDARSHRRHRYAGRRAQDLPASRSSTTPPGSSRTPPSRLREHHGVPAGPQAGDPAPRHSQAPVRRQRRRLPLSAPRAGVRQARHHPHPRPPLSAPGQRQEGALVPHRTHAVPHAPAAEDRRASTPSIAASGPGSRRNTTRGLIAGLEGRTPARPLGAVRGRRAHARHRAGPRCDSSSSSEAQGPARPHRQLWTASSTKSTRRSSARPSPCASTRRHTPGAARRGLARRQQVQPGRAASTLTPTASCAAITTPRAPRGRFQAALTARRGLSRCATMPTSKPKERPADVPQTLRPHPLSLRQGTPPDELFVSLGAARSSRSASTT